MNQPKFSALEAATAVLGEYKKRMGAEVLWVCPVHDDHSPSLSVNKINGKWLCGPCGRGGETGWSLLGFITGTDPADIPAMCAVAESVGLREKYVKPAQQQSWEIENTYDYTDEQGNLLHQTVRLKGKIFRQRRPDGRGGWIWNLGERVVLYNLPAVILSKTVVCCEGEKDCDSLRQWGIAATTNPMGSRNWKPHYNDFLRGKHIVVLPDNDEAGIAHAEKLIAEVLPVAASFKVVNLPGLPPKGDVTDWIEAGGTKDQLRDLVMAAPRVSQGIPAVPPEPTLDIFDLMPGLDKVPDIAVEWVVEDLVPRGALTVLAGERGSFKSFACLDLAARVAVGYPFAGHKTVATPVLYLDRENGAQIINTRKTFLGIGDTSSEDGLSYWGTWMPEDPCGLKDERLIATAEKRKPVIIFDSLIRFAQGKDENSADAMAKVTELFRRLIKAGATVVVIAHKSDKPGSSPYRGSSEILAGCDMGWSLTKEPGNQVKWSCIKNRFREETFFTFRLQPGGFIEVVGEPRSSRPLAQAVRQ